MGGQVHADDATREDTKRKVNLLCREKRDTHSSYHPRVYFESNYPNAIYLSFHRFKDTFTLDQQFHSLSTRLRIIF